MFNKKKEMAKYIINLEDSLYDFTNVVDKNKDNQKKLVEELANIKSTSFYQKVRWQKADEKEKIRIMHEKNDFYITGDDRPKYI